MKRTTFLLLLLGSAAVLFLATRFRLPIAATHTELGVAIEGRFIARGEYPGEPFFTARPIRNWGSWAGSDENQGTLTLGPFAAPERLRFGISGYPDRPGIELYLLHEGSAERLPLSISAISERWRVVELPLPSAWVGRSVRLIAADQSSAPGGWIALSEPIRGGRGDRVNVILNALTTLLAVGFAFRLCIFAARRWQPMRERSALRPPSFTSGLMVTFRDAFSRNAPNVARSRRLIEVFVAWWRRPQLNFWVFAVLAVLLAVRKPDALHTPQLWAEDGSIFLMQADLHGIRALTTPYMGYLHLLPRLIAQAAPRLLDPAYWPAFYNGVAFALWVLVLGRLFSSRLDLPGKPWLALSFILGPVTGEVLFNITNLQWLTAFVLLQQALIARPITTLHRISDLITITVVALTGPFAIAFAPLFVWRWWRDRHRDNLLLLLVVGSCAAVQAWFVLRTAPRFDYQSAPFDVFAVATVLARRLLVWPIFGSQFALTVPKVALGICGGLAIASVMVWALRPDPARRYRGPIVAAFGLILLASVFRTRPDTWAEDNLYFGDRYFYIPRVLLAWLLIWEFHAAPRAVAVTARLACLAAVIVHLPDYPIPPPPDLKWSKHVEPIRQGVRADLPILPEGWTLEYRGRPRPD